VLTALSWTGGARRAGRARGRALLERVLDADLREVVLEGGDAGALPANVGALHGVALSDVLLQVVASSDVAESRRNLERAQARTEELAAAAQDGPPVPRPTRLLKLELTDGTRTVIAIEHRRMPQLLGVPGEKLLLTRTLMRRGLLLLGPDNCTVLGGRLPVVAPQPQQPQQPQPQQPQQPQQHPQQQPQQQPQQPRQQQQQRQPQPQLPPPQHQLPLQLQHQQQQQQQQERPPPPQPQQVPPLTLVQQQPHLPRPRLAHLKQQQPAILLSEAASAPHHEQVATPLYGYIRDISVGESRLVRAFVMSVRGPAMLGPAMLKDKEGNYMLNVELGDGVGGCVARIAADVVERELMGGLSAAGLSALKKADSAAYLECKRALSSRLSNFEGVFRLARVAADRDAPAYVLQAVEAPDKQFTTFLLESLL
jgi:hypothetical protein